MEDRPERDDATAEAPASTSTPPLDDAPAATEPAPASEDVAVTPQPEEPQPEEVAAAPEQLDGDDAAPADQEASIEAPEPAEEVPALEVPEPEEAPAPETPETEEAPVPEAEDAATEVAVVEELGPEGMEREAAADSTEPPAVEEPTEVEPPAPSVADEAPPPEEPAAAEAEEGLRETEVADVEEPAAAVAVAADNGAEPSGDGDPFSGPGDWYVVHTYAGYENKVKTNLQTRIQTMQMQDKIFDVYIPMEDVMEIKGGKKQVVKKKTFPGYLLVKMVYDDDSWVCVRNTPGVTGFVSAGSGQRPTPLSRRDVEKILTVQEEDVKKPALHLDFAEGDVVRIIAGPFADFNGTISDINPDQSKVRVMVNIFDRETPVELSFDQVARV